jgi:2-polyprenyl-6-methoxyphenol hydroxylase-like FAD-dependent oxidoreductase
VSGQAEQFDVVIVGARCAGSPLGALLAGRGLRVCVVDGARFPSETLSTHVIQPCGVAALGRLGVLDSLLGAGAVPLTRFTLVAEDARIDADLENEAEAFGAPGLCVRRVTLDDLLVRAAASAGAEVRTGEKVCGLLRDNGRIEGVETARGALRARLVVGADGRRSTVAALAGAAEYHVAPPGRLFAWAYFEGAADREPRLRLGRLGDLAFLASPTDGGLYMAGVCPSLQDSAAFLAERERRFAEGLRRWPELDALLAGATRVGSIRVMVSWHGYFRSAAGPGWVLLGDAGHFKDPTPAQGISDALRQAEHLADAIEAGLGGGAEIDARLERWSRWRDQDAYEMHWFASDLGAAGLAGPLHVQVIRDLAGERAATEKMLRLLNHELRPSELFTPRMLGGALARVVRERPREVPALARELTGAVRSELGRRRARDRFIGPRSGNRSKA